MASSSAGAAAAHERALLAAARRGDEDAYRGLVEPHRAALLAHCYRMLASVHDAEDALQDALLRAWRGLPRFEGRSSFRSWLYTIATNTCLRLLARRRPRVLPPDRGPPGDPGEPLPGSVWVEPFPDERLAVDEGSATPEARYEQREAIELAFVAALQHLPPRQRAVLVLREVLGFSAREVAEALETTVAAVNSALQRARRTLDERLPERSQQAVLRTLGDDRVRALVERFADAFERGDVDAILSMLTEDATFAMPPYPGWSRGRDAVGESWLMPEGPPPRLRYLPTSANGQPALAAYLLDADAGRYVPIALDVLALEGDRVASVVAFRGADVLRGFGVPDELPR
jgi:RNA polymerase sigma-70 factor (ECF subfamily)